MMSYMIQHLCLIYVKYSSILKLDTKIYLPFNFQPYFTYHKIIYCSHTHNICQHNIVISHIYKTDLCVYKSTIENMCYRNIYIIGYSSRALCWKIGRYYLLCFFFQLVFSDYSSLFCILYILYFHMKFLVNITKKVNYAAFKSKLIVYKNK